MGYYRSDRVQLVTEDMRYPIGAKDNRDFHTWTFRRVGGGPDFDVTVAHLASGDTNRNAIQRGDALFEMTQREFLRPHIMLMDSNFSEHYIDGKGKCPECKHDNMQLIRGAGLVDVLSNSKGLESFKMRHAAGGQDDKFCDLMFDRIDRIIVTGDSITAREVSKPEMYGFKAYDPSHHDAIYGLRTDPNKRKSLKQACNDQKWVSTSEFSQDLASELGVDPKVLGGLYPNKDAPSDHPPVSVQLDMSFNVHPGGAMSNVKRQRRVRDMFRSD